MRPIILGTVLMVVTLQTDSAAALYRSGGTQFVGFHYWLQAEDGTRLTEAQAQEGKGYSLHLRNNVGGYLSVFVTVDGVQLTPMDEYAGFQLQGNEGYVARGPFRLAPEASAERIVVLFARSQTEQVRTAQQALEKLGTLRAQAGPYGLSLVTEIVKDGAGLGTYVVHRDGGQPSTTIRLTR